MMPALLSLSPNPSQAIILTIVRTCIPFDFPSTQRTQSKYESVRVTIKFPKFIILILSRQKYRTLEAKVSRIHPLHFQFFPRETRKPSSDVPAKCRDTWPSLPIHLFTAFPPLLSICVDDPGRLIERGTSKLKRIDIRISSTKNSSAQKGKKKGLMRGHQRRPEFSARMKVRNRRENVPPPPSSCINFLSFDRLKFHSG